MPILRHSQHSTCSYSVLSPALSIGEMEANDTQSLSLGGELNLQQNMEYKVGNVKMNMATLCCLLISAASPVAQLLSQTGILEILLTKSKQLGFQLWTLG